MKPRHRYNGGSEEIKAGIDETRAQMDGTLDELSERLRPRNLIDDLLDYWYDRRHTPTTSSGSSTQGMKKAAGQVKDTAAVVSKTIYHQAQQHPLPALLIGAGIAALFMEGRSRSRSVVDYTEYETEESYEGSEIGPEGYALPHHYSEQGEESSSGIMSKMKDKGSNLAGKMGEGWQKTKQRTSETTGAFREKTGALKERMSEKGAHMKEQAHHMKEQAMEQARHMKEQARHTYSQGVDSFKRTSNDYPLAVGVGCMALGVLAGMLIPSTRREDELVGAARDRLVERSKDTAHNVLERGKHVASVAKDAVKSEVEAQGLTAESLKEKAGRILETAKSAAREEGLSPEALKDKAQAVASNVKEKSREEAMNQQNQYKPQV